MKKTKITTKALSMFLAAIMLFTTISVGIIVPDAGVVAAAAEVNNVNSVTALKNAITTANNNGTGVVTTINLSGNVTSTDALAAFPTITGNVRLNLNGFKIDISHTASGDYGSSQMNIQLPSENAGTDYKGTDYISTAMINVGIGATLQIVNEGSADSEIRVYTDIYDTDNNSGNDAYHQTSSHVIHSAGTLILGDSADSTKNNFRIYAHSSARNDGDDAWKVAAWNQVKVSTSANSYGVTINGSNAIFKMYGGKVEATGVARCYRSAQSNLRVYALNIITCSSAEIYGGYVNLPESPVDSYSGLRQSESDASASADAVISAIRCATKNLYIFDVDCDVKAYTGADTSKNLSMTASNVYCTDGSPATIYGGSFTYWAEAASGDSTAAISNYTVRGSYNCAGYKSLSASKGSNTNNQTSNSDGRTKTASYKAQTLFVHGGSLAFNGINMFDTKKYPTFKDYKSAVESADAATDVYSIALDGSPVATFEDTSNHTCSTYNYKRNGYYQNGWIGRTTPGGPISYADTASAGVASGGGSLFLEPTWKATNYSISYDFAANTEYPAAQTAEQYEEDYGRYTIEDSMLIPAPSRAGYKFGGWKVAYEDADVKSTDNKISWVKWTSQNNMLYGWDSSSSSAIAVNVNGQFGNITLIATWIPVSATVNVDYNRDGKIDKNFEYLPHIKGDQFDVAENFEANPRLDDFHVFSGYYEVEPVGADTNWKASDVLHISDVNPDVYPPEVTPVSDEAINDQFIGKYGPVKFIAKYIARPYTITYYDDDGSLVDTATYTIDNTNKENPDVLAVMPNSGRVFLGWQLMSSDNNSWPSSTQMFNNFPKGANGNVELKAVYDYSAYKYYVKLYDEDGTTLITEVPYSYLAGNTINVSSPKAGYNIDGWTVIGTEIEEGDEAADWTDADITVENGVTKVAPGKIGTVKLKVKYKAKTYTITFDSKDNSIPAPAPLQYTIEDEIILQNLIKTAYDFNGWRVDSCVDGNWDVGSVHKDIANSHGAAKKLYGDVKLVASWSASKYEVTFWLDEDNVITLADKLYYNTEIAISAEKFPKVQKDGYKFLGWDIRSLDETGWAGFRELIGSNKVTQLPKDYYGVISLVADWEPIDYSVNFLFPDGIIPSNPVNPVTYNVEQENIALPDADDVIITGYTINGWTLPSAKDGWAADDYNFNVKGPGFWGNVTLVADVTPTNYKVQYVDSEGNSLGIEDTPYTIKDTVSLRDYIKNGYTTLGWYVLADGQTTGSWRTETLYDHKADYPGMYGNVKLYPDLEINEYTITFLDNNGSLLGEFDYNIEYEGALPAYEKAGYVLTGWQITKADGNWQANTIFRAEDVLKGAYGDVTLTAIWNLRSYEIVWKNYDGSVLFRSNVNHGAMPEYTEATPVKPEDSAYTYEFIGWMNEPQIVTGAATYTAVFKANPKKFDVTWVAPEGTFTTEYKYGDRPVYKDGEMPVKTEDGKTWTFVGWKDGNGNYLNKETIVSADVTYTAIFEEKAVSSYKVTWIVGADEYDTYWTAGETPSYPGSPYFAGGNGYLNMISGWDPSITAVSGDTEYNAIVKRVYIAYDAVFLPMGGQFTGDKVVSYNTNAGLTMPQPVKEGYAFAGWKVISSENTSWTVGELYKDVKYTGKWGDVKFEAQWEIITYSVTIRTESATQIQEYTIESADRLPLLTKTGYTHTGWLIYSSDENSSWTMGDVVEVNKLLRGMYGNVKIEPVWTAKTYKINWVSGDEVLTVEIKFGEEIVPLAPVAKNGYTAKWREEIPQAMGAKDLTFNADYSVIEYYLKYNTNGGNTIAGFPYYVTSTETLAAPVKEGSTFKGWKVSLGSGSWDKDTVYAADYSLEGSYGDVTLTAVWEINSYDITWIVGDETTVTSWYYGTRPTYNGMPAKPSDDRVSYEFSGKWKTETGKLVDNSAIPVVTGAAIYEAQFNEVNRRYIISWDIDGVITTQTYFYGDAVICPFVGEKTPTRPSTGEFDYTFSGWSPEIGRVTSDVTYVAVFEKHVKLQGLSLNKTSVYIEVNATETLTAIMTPSTATSNDVEWISNNRNIATVDENGKVFGVGAGETLVRVQSRDGKFKAYCMVNVIPVLAEYIVVSAAGASTTRLPGETVQLYATIMPEYASNRVVKWTSSDPEIATVNSSGLVTYGLKMGTATITAHSDGYATGSITVTTTNESADIEGSDKTYTITFAQSSSAYIIGGYTFDSVTLVCKEGATLEFLLAEPHFVVLNGYQYERTTDGIYRIENIRENYTIYATERPDTGLEPEEPDDNNSGKLSFFDRLKAFFRSIVEFFRGLFGG